MAILRNLLVAVAASACAILLAAVGQGAFENGLPLISDRMVGATSLGTYALLVFLAALFFSLGFIVPRWLKTEVPLGWLLFPIVALYVTARLAQPYVFGCNPVQVSGCWVVQSPFFVSMLAVAAGCYTSHLRARLRDAV